MSKNLEIKKLKGIVYDSKGNKDALLLMIKEQKLNNEQIIKLLRYLKLYFYRDARIKVYNTSCAVADWLLSEKVESWTSDGWDERHKNEFLENIRFRRLGNQ